MKIGRPQVDLSWMYDGHIVSKTNGPTVTYNFTPTIGDDKNEYTCLANNSFSLLSSTIRLDIRCKILILRYLKKTSVKFPTFLFNRLQYYHEYQSSN